MKHLFRFCACAVALGLCAVAASADTFDSSSTTVNYLGSNSSTSLDWSAGSSVLTSGSYTAAPSGTVDLTNIGVWQGPVGTSSWVSYAATQPGGTVVSTGTYVFQSTFSDASIGTDADITVMADDTTAVYLNGVLLAGTPATDQGAAQYCTVDAPNCTNTVYTLTLPADLLNAGDNTLTFGVEQLYGSAMGLDFEVSAAPEPSSLLLLGTGLLGAAEAFRRRLRA